MPYLSIRHQSRIIILQSLYEWDFDETKNPEEILERNIATSGYKVDEEFCRKAIKGIVKNIEAIDKTIVKTAPEWPLEQIAIIDRSILRIGIFELLHDKEVPPKAVINEAVELGKSFGGENSGKFVNGVLGTVYRASDRYEEEEMVISAGGIVYRIENNKPVFLVIKNSYGKWTFPKGKVEEGETWQEAALREINEETGIAEGSIIGDLGDVKFTDKSQDDTIKKTVHFYLVRTEQENAKAQEKERVQEVAWMNKDEIVGKLDYDNLNDVFKKALEILEK